MDCVIMASMTLCAVSIFIAICCLSRSLIMTAGASARDTMEAAFEPEELEPCLLEAGVMRAALE